MDQTTRLLVVCLLSAHAIHAAPKHNCRNPNKWSSWTSCCCVLSRCGFPSHKFRWRNATSHARLTPAFRGHSSASYSGTNTSLGGSEHLAGDSDWSSSSSYSSSSSSFSSSPSTSPSTSVSISPATRDDIICHSTYSVRLCTCLNYTEAEFDSNALTAYGISLEQALHSLGVRNYTTKGGVSGARLAAHLYRGGVVSSMFQQRFHHTQRGRTILSNIIRSIASFMYSFGGIVPFYPQYQRIRKLRNEKGFSTTVCLILLIANILRIQFWMLKHFHIALLLQSVSMIIAQLLLLDLCIHVRTGKVTLEDSTTRAKSSFWVSPINHFWAWSDFRDYMQFIVMFSVGTSFVTRIFSFSTVYAEIIGSISVMVEAIILVPQSIQNYERQSTEGLSYAMMVMWTGGDFLKLTYLTASEVPIQFVLCTIMQCSVDVVIMLQISLYAETKNAKPVSLPRRLSRLMRSDVVRRKNHGGRSGSISSLSSENDTDATCNETVSLLDAARPPLDSNERIKKKEVDDSLRVKAR